MGRWSLRPGGGHQFAVPARLDADDAEAVLSVVVRDALDEARQNFLRRCPFSIHAYRNVCRNFIVLAHNLVIVPIGLVVFAIPIDWHVLEPLHNQWGEQLPDFHGKCSSILKPGELSAISMRAP
jgi:hypothetical protein